jgi:hypothetical protein
MTPLTYEALRSDPKLIQPLLERARRERAQAVHRLLIAPIKALFTRPNPKVRPSLGNPARG